MQKNDKLKFVS